VPILLLRSCEARMPTKVLRLVVVPLMTIVRLLMCAMRLRECVIERIREIGSEVRHCEGRFVLVV